MRGVDTGARGRDARTHARGEHKQKQSATRPLPAAPGRPPARSVAVSRSLSPATRRLNSAGGFCKLAKAQSGEAVCSACMDVPALLADDDGDAPGQMPQASASQHRRARRPLRASMAGQLSAAGARQLALVSSDDDRFALYSCCCCASHGCFHG